MAAKFPQHGSQHAFPCRWLVSAVSGAALLLASAGCGKDTPSAKVEKRAESKHGLSEEQRKLPLVQVGSTTVTVGDFADQIAEKSPYLRARYASPERRRELLEELLKFELLANEAARRGLDKSDEVQRAKRQVMVQQMMKAEFEDKVKLSDITDQEIEAYYKAHPSEFNKPAQVRASQIVVRDEAKARRLLKQLAESKDDEQFRKLVAEHSEDELTKTRGGDLQFFSKPSERVDGDPPVHDAVAEAAFKLANPGDMSPEPIKTREGFHIVRLTAHRKALARTLDQVRRPIQNKLWREKREAALDAFLAQLRSKAKVSENLALLDQVQIQLPDNEAGRNKARGKAGSVKSGGSL